MSRSTVVREIKAYRYDKLERSCRFGGQNWCVKRRECGVFGVCKGGKGGSATRRRLRERRSRSTAGRAENELPVTSLAGHDGARSAWAIGSRRQW